jgi:hypothetical protein
LTGALAGGLLVGVAFHCKEPLGVFVLAVLAAAVDPRLPLRPQWRRAALVAAGLAVGLVTYKVYELYKFPPGTTDRHAELMGQYVPFWTSNPLPALAGLTLSPGAGALWYCPPLLLGVVGLWRWRRTEVWLFRALLAGVGGFVGFLCFLTFFTGDPTWGPRYLTPVYALFWLFVPAGAAALRPQPARLVLALGVLVQLLGLSVDSHRLYIARNLPSAFYYYISPWLYFDRDVAHLINRPREIGELLRADGGREVAFSPGPEPTFAPPVIDHMDRPDAAQVAGAVGLASSPGGALAAPAALHRDQPAVVQRYHVFNSFRPFWASQWYLAPEERPVDLGGAVAVLLALALAGGAGLWAGWWLLRPSHCHIATLPHSTCPTPAVSTVPAVASRGQPLG